MDRQAELTRLSKADQQISDAERNVSEQRLHLEQLLRDGHDTSLAERTLSNFEAILLQMREHRATILKKIEEIDQRKI